MMKRLFLFYWALCSISLLAQNKSDLGFFIGSSYYMGDINPSVPFYSPGISLGAVYRYNINPRHVIKASFDFLTISASDIDFTDSYQKNRRASFNSSLYDFATQFEFNFLPLKFAEQKIKFTTYISTGIGMMYASSSAGIAQKLNITLPASLGCRFALGRRVSTGFEWNLRKLFNDKIDGVENIGDPGLKSALHNNDYYFFYGVFITYKVFDFNGTCPAFENKY